MQMHETIMKLPLKNASSNTLIYINNVLKNKAKHTTKQQQAKHEHSTLKWGNLPPKHQGEFLVLPSSTPKL